MSSIDAALVRARTSIAAAEARSLLVHTLGRSNAWLAAHGEAALSAEQQQRFGELVVRRAAGWPIAYLVGAREFYGRSFAVSPGVLIPRPETELLVEQGLAMINGLEFPRLLDLGCGSGCIAITLALEAPCADVTAVDVSAEALAIARDNAAAHGVKLQLLEGDWFSTLDGRSFDLIVANPPYVAAGDTHLQQGDLRFEPELALVAGERGLAAIRRIVGQARQHLAPGGALLVEHGYDQAEAVRGLFIAAGLSDVEQRPDLAGILRVTLGRLTLQASAPYNPD